MSNTKQNEQQGRVAVSFAAIDPYVERNMVSAKETRYAGQERIRWGDGDRFPQYLCELYNDCATLASIIDGTVNFIAGNDVLVTLPGGKLTFSPRHTNMQVVRSLAYNEEKFGGIAIEVIRAKDGTIAQTDALPIQYVRSNKDNTVFWYSEKWGKATSGDKPVRRLAFMPGLDWAAMDEKAREEHAATILYLKGDTTTTYPVPRYHAALKAAEMERNIDDYHLNSLDNGFVASAMVNFNNGIPSDEIKEEIERDFSEKFGGHANAGRIAFSWNPNKDSQTTIIPFKTEDFGERYNALEKACRQKLYTSFAAVPALFGLLTESTGFSEQEFDQAFRLYNRTQVRPVQTKIVDAFEYIYGAKVLEIIPFSLDEAREQVAR